MGILITISAADIRHVKHRGLVPTGNVLSQLMNQHGIRNEDVAEKLGYAVTTVDRARNPHRDAAQIKPRTMADLTDTVRQLIKAQGGTI
jgi:hypothetical protein